MPDPTLKFRNGDSVYLPCHLTDRFNPLARGYVSRVFTAPAVLNPFNLSSAPLRADRPCVEIKFLRPEATVIADLTQGDIMLVNTHPGQAVPVYVGVQAPGNGGGVQAPPQPALTSFQAETVVKAYQGTISPTPSSLTLGDGSMMAAVPLTLGEGGIG